MQMRRQAQPRSQQPTANSKQQTANSKQPKTEVHRWLRLLSTFSLLVPVCFRQASAVDLEFLLHRNPEILWTSND